MDEVVAGDTGSNPNERTPDAVRTNLLQSFDCPSRACRRRHYCVRAYIESQQFFHCHSARLIDGSLPNAQHVQEV